MIMNPTNITLKFVDRRQPRDYGKKLYGGNRDDCREVFISHIFIAKYCYLEYSLMSIALRSTDVTPYRLSIILIDEPVIFSLHISIHRLK